MSKPQSQSQPSSENAPTKQPLLADSIIQSNAILSGLLATVAAQLLTFFKDDSKFKHPESITRDAILVLTYMSLTLGIFATIASIALSRAAAGVWFKPNKYMVVIVDLQLLTFLYCISIFTVASVVAYLCLEEGRKIKIAVLVVSGAYSLSMTWYVAMVGMDIPDPFSKVNNDAKPEADAEP